ncbi:MAG: YciI family protein [Alphaproteobacteria bacterium]|nr:YciI family protein [Alphaproteobacteria bacterium]
MQFLVLASDGTDVEAPMRRLKVRAAHLANMARLKKAGRYLIGGPILDDQEKMVGSAMILDFPDRDALYATLAEDPYITEKVWHSIEVKNFRVAPLD